MKRTNNNMEAWHKQFENSARKLPSVYRLIQMFRVEQTESEKRLATIIAGKNDQKGLSEKELRIFVLVKEYKRSNIEEFFAGMIPNLEADSKLI
jgi:hypothetical protein